MDQISIGRIRGTHGVKGLLKIESFSGEYGHFYTLDKIVLKGRSGEKRFNIESIKPFGNSVLLKLEGLETPEDAKRYSGWEIQTSRENAAPLSENEFYFVDLVGSVLKYKDRNIGRVISIIQGGNGELLEVKTDDDGTRKLIPFMERFIGEVDTEKGYIELVSDWILE